MSNEFVNEPKCDRLKENRWCKIGDSESVEVDSIVTSVLQGFVNRAVLGKKKYGTDLDREDLSMLEWIQHAQEEHMDAILYLEKLKKQYIKG